MAIYLVFLHFLHSKGFMGYRETKKRSLRTSHISSGTSDYLSFLSFCLKFASFLLLTSTSLRAFPPLVFLASRLFKLMFFLGSEFQPPPASMDLIHFPFDTVWILKVEFLQRFIVVSFIFCFWKYSSQCRH